MSGSVTPPLHELGPVNLFTLIQVATSKRETSTLKISSTDEVIIDVSQPDSPMARFLAAPSPSSLPSSTPSEPRAMTVAKSNTPKQGIKMTTMGRKRSDSPSPPSPSPISRKRTSDLFTPCPRESKRRVSGQLNLPVRSPVSRSSFPHIRSSKARTKRKRYLFDPDSSVWTRKILPRNDHWSPNTSRRSSPISSPAVIPVPMLFSSSDWYSKRATRSLTPTDQSPSKTRSQTKLFFSARSPRSTSPPELPKPLVASSPTKKHPSLQSVSTASPWDEEDKKHVCYNCGKRGHWFMDCLVACGRCGKDGHRTIDCKIVATREAYLDGKIIVALNKT